MTKMIARHVREKNLSICFDAMHFLHCNTKEFIHASPSPVHAYTLQTSSPVPQKPLCV